MMPTDLAPTRSVRGPVRRRVLSGALVAVLALVPGCGAGSAALLQEDSPADAPPPDPFQVQARDPAPGASDVEPGSSMLVVLSESIASVGSQPAELVALLPDGTVEPVTAQVGLQPEEGSIALVPEAPLRLRGEYELRLSGEIRSTDGRSLGAAETELSWTFRVRDGAFSPGQLVDFNARRLSSARSIDGPDPRFVVFHTVEADQQEALVYLLLPDLLPGIAVYTDDPIRRSSVLRATSDQILVRVLTRVESGSTVGFDAYVASNSGSTSPWSAPARIGPRLSALGNCERPPVPADVRTSDGDVVTFFAEGDVIEAAFTSGTSPPPLGAPVWTSTSIVTGEPIGNLGGRTVVAEEQESGSILVAWMQGANRRTLASAVLERNAGSWSFVSVAGQTIATQELEQELALRRIVRTRNGALVLVATDSGAGSSEEGIPYARTYLPGSRSWTAPAPGLQVIGDQPTVTGDNCADDRAIPPINAQPGDDDEVVVVWVGRELTASPNLTSEIDVWAFTLNAPPGLPPTWSPTFQSIVDPIETGALFTKAVSLDLARDDDGVLVAAFTMATDSGTGYPRGARRSTEGVWIKHRFDTPGGDAILLRMSNAHASGQRIVAWSETDELDEMLVSTFE